MGPRRRHPLTNGRAFPSILAVTGAVGLTVTALVGWTLWSARLDAARNAAIASENLAMSLARGVESTIARYDGAMLAIENAMASAPSADTPSSDVIAGLTITPDLGSIAITDDRGLVIASVGRPVHPRGSNVAGQALFLR